MAWETAKEDPGADEDVRPNLRFQPAHYAWSYLDEAREAAVARLNRHLCLSMVCGAIAAAITVALFNGMRTSWIWISLCSSMALLGHLLWSVIVDFHEYSEIARDLQGRGEAQAEFPDPQRDWPYEVNWWSLRKCGVDFGQFHENLKAPLWKLSGNPWGVLTRDDLMLPVFLWRSESGELHDQHYARVSAYCHLIESSTGQRSPFGILLRYGTYEAVAIADCTRGRTALSEGLHLARASIRSSEEEERDPVAPAEALCRRCPFGRPHRRVRGETESRRHGRVLSPTLLRDPESSMEYHSRCGDRFRWCPPHEDVRLYQLQLRR